MGLIGPVRLQVGNGGTQGSQFGELRVEGIQEFAEEAWTCRHGACPESRMSSTVRIRARVNPAVWLAG